MAGANPVARLARWSLAALVLALALSWGWAQFGPRPGPRTHGSASRVIRVQVLNGSGEGGVAARVAAVLREGGFHVVEVGNADRFDYFATLVVARSDNVGPAADVARFLGDPPVIRQAWASDLAEVTVVIGSDRSRLRLD